MFGCVLRVLLSLSSSSLGGNAVSALQIEKYRVNQITFSDSWASHSQPPAQPTANDRREKRVRVLV